MAKTIKKERKTAKESVATKKRESLVAYVEIAGSTEKVSEGDFISVNNLPEAGKEKLKFSNVVLIIDGEKSSFGAPFIKDAFVEAKKVADMKGKKIKVKTFKAKSRYRKIKGHRQALTKLEILKISY